MFAEKNEFFRSGSRSENPQIFRLPQCFFLRIDKLQFVNALGDLRKEVAFDVIGARARGR